MNNSENNERNHNIFIYDHIKVFFKHTDYYGLVHQYNYLEWMSYAREAFFNKIFPAFMTDDILTTISMVTIKAEYEHYNDAKFGDEISIIIYTENVRRVSFDVIFEFYNKASNNKLGLGKQTLVFLQRESTRPAYIPNELFYEIKLGEKKNGTADARTTIHS